MTATQLLSQLQSIGTLLRDRGAKTVALYADNSPAWAIVDLACQLASLCIVPVPTFFSSSQVDHLLTSAGVDTLIYDIAREATLAARYHRDSVEIAESIGLFIADIVPEKRPGVPLHTAKITFTSGSTGEPKGVCLSSDQCLTVAQSLAYSIDVLRPRHLSMLPLSTLLENIGGIYMPLLTGGTSVLVPPGALGMSGSSGLDSERFLSAFEEYQPNTLILVPQLLLVLVMAVEQGWPAPESLQFIAVGGARVAPELVLRARACGLPVYEGYGLTECASVVSLNCPRYDRPGTSGRVLPHATVQVRDGELEVSGNTFLGYMDQPISWGATLVSTGDVGTVDESGFVTIGGRSKNILITSFGRNVSPEWVESELFASCSIHQAVVVGEGRPCCAALLYPVKVEMTDADIQSVVDRANEELPDYAQIGHWLRLVEPMSVENGLITENGRPRRYEIQEHFARDIDQLYSDIREINAL